MAAPEIAPPTALDDGIFQIRLPMAGNPLRWVHAYALEESDGLTLVDCGWKADDVLAALRDGLAAFGFALADVRRVLITHQHFDHYGLAGTLLRAGVGEVMMHRRDWERVQEVIGRRIASERVENAYLVQNGFVPGESEEGPGSRAELTTPTRFLDDGERVGRLTVLWTPGHAPGHLCFLDARSGRMLTGDHVLDPITPHVGVWRERGGDPLGDYVRSLEKVGRSEGTGALPGHGEPFPDLRGRVAAILAHTERREELVLAIAGSDTISAGDVARRLPWTRRERAFESLSAWHQEFAMSETIAHLVNLLQRGVMEREDRADGTIFYRVTRRGSPSPLLGSTPHPQGSVAT
jgi:glyoxylase-like metal-dependent hydrolase (beta-lactamase superfamily II)